MMRAYIFRKADFPVKRLSTFSGKKRAYIENPRHNVSTILILNVILLKRLGKKSVL